MDTEHSDTTGVDTATRQQDGGSSITGTSLTVLCGPHCGTKDGHTGHCDVCHMIRANFRKIENNHLGGTDDEGSTRRRNGVG